jgi:hypothetical protein
VAFFCKAFTEKLGDGFLPGIEMILQKDKRILDYNLA